MSAVPKLKLDPDATHLFSLWAAVEEYLFRYKRDTQDLVLLHCLTLLVSLKNNHLTWAERLLKDEPNFDTSANPAHSVLHQRLWLASSEAAPRIRRRREILSLDISSDNINLRLFSWVAEQRHEILVRLLLEAFGIIVSEELGAWCSLQVAAGARHIAALTFHLSEPGINHPALAKWGPVLVTEAAEREDLMVLDILLKAGSVVDSSRVWFRPCYTGRDAIVNRLLQAGVDVNRSDALRTAIVGGHETTVDLLLRAGARADLDTLHAALHPNHETIAYRCLEAGAPVDAYSLTKAVENGWERIVDKILQSSTISDLSGAFEAAIKQGNEVMVDKLLKADAGGAGDSSLYWAISCGQEAILHRLLQGGADTKGESLLSVAASNGYRGMVNLLLQAGADYMIDDALNKAVIKGDEEIVDILLEAGADINAGSALAEAVLYGRKSIVEKFLRAGAIVNTNDVNSALLVNAMDRGDEAVVVMLLKAGASIDPLLRSNSLTDLQSSINRWDPRLVDLILQEFAEDKPLRG